MSLVVFDIECLEEKIVEELGVFKMELYWDTVSSHPKTINLLFKQSGTLKIYMGLTKKLENWIVINYSPKLFTYNRILCKCIYTK